MITFNKIGRMGRFGNQLFQYACLYSIAKEKQFEFGIPYDNKSEDEHHHFCLPEAFSNLSAKDSSKINNKHNYYEYSFDYDQNILSILNNTDISGYFQSEKYFKKYRTDITKEFTFDEKILNFANKIKNDIGPCISIHVRLTDYVKNYDRYPICSREYYIKSLEKMPADHEIILFSDDKELAKQYLNINKKINILDINDKFIEMCLMTLCEYHITANSTFSWWGAWLSNSKLTTIPKNWFGPNHHIKSWKDIYPENWVII